MITCTMQDMKTLDSVNHFLEVSLNNDVPIDSCMTVVELTSVWFCTGIIIPAYSY